MKTPPRPVIGLVVLVLLAGAGWAAYYFLANSPTDDRLTLYGNVDVREVDLAFNVEGPIDVMHVEEGDRVGRGQVLAALEADRFIYDEASARARVREAKARLVNARRTLARQEKLFRGGNTSEQRLDDARQAVDATEAEIEALEQAAALAAYRLDRTRLVSTVDGTVLVRIREPGAVVLGNSPVYSIAIDDPVWVRTYVDEPNLGRVFPGMTALVMTDTDPEAPYEGWVGFISPTAEFTPKTVETPELRTDLVYRLRVYVANPDRRLRQGMPVTVELVPEVFDRSAAGARALAAPAEAQQPSPETRDDRQP